MCCRPLLSNDILQVNSRRSILLLLELKVCPSPTHQPLTSSSSYHIPHQLWTNLLQHMGYSRSGEIRRFERWILYSRYLSTTSLFQKNRVNCLQVNVE